MDKQEIFNTVATHLFEQGHRAMLSTSILPLGQQAQFAGPTFCAYRGDNGDKCAFGILISDEDYSQEMETQPVHKVIGSYSCMHKFQAHIGVLRDLQDAHDTGMNWKDTKSMRHTLAVVCGWHDINTSILATLSFKDR